MLLLSYIDGVIFGFGIIFQLIEKGIDGISDWRNGNEEGACEGCDFKETQNTVASCCGAYCGGMQMRIWLCG